MNIEPAVTQKIFVSLFHIHFDSSGINHNCFRQILFATFPVQLKRKQEKLILNFHVEKFFFFFCFSQCLSCFLFEHDCMGFDRERMKNVFAKYNQFQMTGVDRITCTTFPSRTHFSTPRQSYSMSEFAWHSFYQLSGSDLLRFLSLFNLVFHSSHYSLQFLSICFLVCPENLQEETCKFLDEVFISNFKRICKMIRSLNGSHIR